RTARSATLFLRVIPRRSSAERSRLRGLRDPEFVKHAGDLAGLAVYLGLGQLRGRRPGRARRLIRSLTVRNQIREAFAPEQKSGGRGKLVVVVGAAAGFALTRSARRRRQSPGQPPVQTAGDPVTRESDLAGALVER